MADNLLNRNSIRLLREQWSSPAALAQELFMIMSDEPVANRQPANATPQLQGRIERAAANAPTSTDRPIAIVRAPQPSIGDAMRRKQIAADAIRGLPLGDPVSVRLGDQRASWPGLQEIHRAGVQSPGQGPPAITSGIQPQVLPGASRGLQVQPSQPSGASQSKDAQQGLSASYIAGSSPSGGGSILNRSRSSSGTTGYPSTVASTGNLNLPVPAHASPDINALGQYQSYQPLGTYGAYSGMERLAADHLPHDYPTIERDSSDPFARKYYDLRFYPTDFDSVRPTWSGSGTSSFIGQLTADSTGPTCTVQLFPNGPAAAAGDTVTVTILQLADGETVPGGTWLACIQQFGKTYSSQVPIWLD